MHVSSNQPRNSYQPKYERKDAGGTPASDKNGNIEEIKTSVNKLGQAWEDFKKKNDERLAEIEKKGSADPLHTEQLEKMNTFMDETKERMEAIEKAAARPAGGSENKQEGDTEEVKAYGKALNGYLRKGNTSGLDDLQTKALSVGSDPDGGYVVTPAMSAQINKLIYETSPLRQLASIETISTDALEMLDDLNEASVGWVSESGSRPETNTPQIGKRNIPTHELYAEPRATQKLLDDASINMESWLNDKVADKFARTEATAFISGDGVGKPRGILGYTPTTVANFAWGNPAYIPSGTSGAVTFDGLINTVTELKEGYMNGASWLMKRATEGAVRVLKDGQGRYLWEPGLQGGKPNSLLGFPVNHANDMDTIAASAFAAAFGNWKMAYTIVDRIGIRILRDQYTAKPYVKFYTTKRVGGDVTNFEAYRLLKLSTS